MKVRLSSLYKGEVFRFTNNPKREYAVVHKAEDYYLIAGLDSLTATLRCAPYLWVETPPYVTQLKLF